MLVYHKLLERDDAISREAVLSKIKEVCFSEEWLQFRIDNGSNGQRDFIIDYIEQLPAVATILSTNTEKGAIKNERKQKDEN